jgi:hypothetical protein
MSSLQSTWPRECVDYCVWRPEHPSLVEGLLADPPDASVLYSLDTLEESGQSASSIVINLKIGEGIRIGRLQCYFPRSESAAGITIDRWVSVVGDHLPLEIGR